MVNQERILFIFHDEQSSCTKHRAAYCEISFWVGLLTRWLSTLRAEFINN